MLLSLDNIAYRLYYVKREKKVFFSQQAKHGNQAKGTTMKTLLEIADVRDPRGGGGRKKHVFKEIIAIAILGSSPAPRPSTKWRISASAGASGWGLS